jgi:hypothetical protein
MRKILLLAGLAAFGTAATAADKSTCAAKPFSFNKPSPAGQKSPPPTKVADAAPAKPVEKPKPAPKPKSKADILGDCAAKTKKPA